MRIFVKILAGIIVAAVAASAAAVNSFAGDMSAEFAPELNEGYTYHPGMYGLSAPAAYRVKSAVNYVTLGLGGAIAPVDVFSRGGLLYVTCVKTSAIYVLDEDLRLVTVISEVKGSERASFNAPEGVYVNADGFIYVADTQNNRVVVVDIDGNLKREYADPRIKVLGESVSFYPSKIAVDNTGRMYVIGKNINRGVIELTTRGEFSTFIGAPKVKTSTLDALRRMFMTDEQKKRSERFIPTEYNNIAIDGAGFVYGTIGSVDAAAIRQAARSSAKSTPDDARPVVKLSPSGSDVLTRRGNVPIIGELEFSLGNHSYICDVDIRADGIYSILDSRHGKIFTYDMYGNLLYVFGNLGGQYGNFSSPSSLCYVGENIVVADQVNGYITVFEPTEYGRALNYAVNLDYDGKFDEAAALWTELVKQNSNLYLAYTGIGKTYYRDKDYTTAMVYFKMAWDMHYYDQANFARRKIIIEKYFPFAFIVVVGIFGTLWGRGIYKKRKGGGER